jgi:hypothetical protein
MDDDKVIAEAAQSAAVLYETNGWTWTPSTKGGTKFTPDAIRLGLQFAHLLDGFFDTESGEENFQPISRRGGRLMVYRAEDSVILAVEVGVIYTTPYEVQTDG